MGIKYFVFISFINEKLPALNRAASDKYCVIRNNRDFVLQHPFLLDSSGLYAFEESDEVCDVI